MLMEDRRLIERIRSQIYDIAADDPELARDEMEMLDMAEKYLGTNPQKGPIDV